jgi:hypothetical protein
VIASPFCFSRPCSFPVPVSFPGPLGDGAMRYSEFRDRIERMALAAPADACHRFAIDSIERMAESSGDAIESEMSAAERGLMSELFTGLADRSPDELATKLAALSGSMEKDPTSGIVSTRGIEFRPDLVELVCAIDSYIRYRQTGDPSLIAAIAINSVNSVDYHIGGDGGGYSIENMLGSPLMASEFARVQRLLLAERGESGGGPAVT